MNAAATPQPAPVKRDTPGMHDLVAADIRQSGATELLVIADLEARKTFGLEKYGTMLQAFNGRDPLMDAYQETLDQVVYLRQCVDEHPTDVFMQRGYAESLKLAVFLRRRLEVRNGA